MDKKIAVMLSILAVLLCFHQLNIEASGKEGYEIADIRIYKDTPAWKLALAVKNQDARGIERIAKNEPHILNYQDPKYGATLLLWAVGTERYKAAEALLKGGADPDIASTDNTEWGGDTPLLVASGFSWVDRSAKKDPKYVKLLLRYGADPNKVYTGFNISEADSVTEPGTSPLMQSIGCGIEKTKALVEGGADINHKTKSGETAAIVALRFKWVPEYAYYLIVEKKAKVNEPYYRGEHMALPGQNPNDEFHPVNILRDWVYDLGSKEHQLKMEIVAEFARQGVNYWDTQINKFTLEHIKKRFPNTWEEYIKKY